MEMVELYLSSASDWVRQDQFPLNYCTLFCFLAWGE